MPIDDSHDEKVEEGGVTKWKNQMALIFVDEGRGNYGALLLTGTAGIKEELSEMGREAVDHQGLDKIYPRTKGLHVFEGELVFSDPNEGPEWQGTFRSITKSDFERLGV